MNKVELREFAGGALQENFQKAFEEIVKNMQDPNTPWKVKRGITIKISLSQNEDRDDSTCAISVEKKMAPVKPIETKFSLGKDLTTGEVFAEEYGKQVRGQMSLEDLKEEHQNEELDTENKVIDLRSPKQA
jgi:hypothetical protein